jgi:ATP-binding cassette subfamily G (WHITE) protein 2 (PDR)
MSVALGVEEKATHALASRTEQAKVESSSSSDSGDLDEIRSEKHQNNQIANLARKYTTESAQHDLGSPFDAPEGSGLDPKSDQFRAKSWARAFYNVRYSSDEALPRVAGVAFRDLNVWGKGSPTDFQSTVGNKISKLPSLFGRGAQKIDILHNLDGLLLPGEQLCVLGPPGYVCLRSLYLQS